MLLLFSIRVAEYPLFGKEQSVRFSVLVFRERSSVFVCVSSPFGFLSGMRDLIVLVPDHCLVTTGNSTLRIADRFISNF